MPGGAAARTVTVRLRVRPRLRGIGGRLLLPNWLAITLDTTIVSWRRLEPDELAHELAHVRQWRRHGRLGYVLAYLRGSVAALAAGGHWYRDNPFEREAREAAAANHGRDPRVGGGTEP